jgi:spore germination cell wall hydrolase CwlJ-like protein
MIDIFAGRRALAGALCALAAATIVAQAAPPVSKPSLEQKTSATEGETPVYRRYSREKECLARAVYFEARGEPLVGQEMVAKVVVNRATSRYYPDTVCEVVYQNDHRRNACQFSFACDDIPDRIREPQAYEIALDVAANALSCDLKCRILKSFADRSTHYHADFVSPSWSKKLAKTAQIGRHIFYYASSM